MFKKIELISELTDNIDNVYYIHVVNPNTGEIEKKFYTGNVALLNAYDDEQLEDDCLFNNLNYLDTRFLPELYGEIFHIASVGTFNSKEYLKSLINSIKTIDEEKTDTLIAFIDDLDESSDDIIDSIFTINDAYLYFGEESGIAFIPDYAFDLSFVNIDHNFSLEERKMFIPVKAIYYEDNLIDVLINDIDSINLQKIDNSYF